MSVFLQPPFWATRRPARLLNWNLVQFAPPAAGSDLTLVSLAEAKLHLKTQLTVEDALVTKWITAARRKVETDTQRALLTQTWDLTFDGFPGTGRLRIPMAPLQSVTSVKYYDTAGVEQTWAAPNYIVDTAGNRIALTDGGSWPSDLRTYATTTIRFIAGWTAASLVPEELLTAMRLLIGWLSMNREPAPFEREAYEMWIAPYVVSELP